MKTIATLKDYKAQFGVVRPAPPSGWQCNMICANRGVGSKGSIFPRVKPLTHNLRAALSACLGPRAVQLGLKAASRKTR